MPSDVRDKSTPPSTSSVVKVLTVDDQAVFRRVAADVIAATPGFEAVGEACSGEEALTAVERLRPELVLLDVRMPGIDGIEAARRITANHPDTVVVLISMGDPEEVGHAAGSSGAVEMVSKQCFGPALLRRLWNTHGDRL